MFILLKPSALHVIITKIKRADWLDFQRQNKRLSALCNIPVLYIHLVTTRSSMTTSIESQATSRPAAVWVDVLSADYTRRAGVSSVLL